VHPAVQSFAIESFDDWRKLLDATYVRLAADRTATGPFCGHIDHARCGGITLSTMVSGGPVRSSARAVHELHCAVAETYRPRSAC
jgi:hypothetical protein